MSKVKLRRHLMSDWPKVHVFLGAPPPPTGLTEEAVTKKNGEERPPAAWRHLELRWKEGRLGAEPGEAPLAHLTWQTAMKSYRIIFYVFYLFLYFNMLYFVPPLFERWFNILKCITLD